MTSALVGANVCWLGKRPCGGPIRLVAVGRLWVEGGCSRLPTLTGLFTLDRAEPDQTALVGLRDHRPERWFPCR